MKFYNANITGVKANLATSEITITAVVPMNEETMSEAEDLAQYAGKEASDVEITIEPRQISFTIK